MGAIETVSKRGYRFIGGVVEISEADAPKNIDAQEIIVQKTDNNSAASENSRKIFVPLVAVFVLLVGTLAIGSWYARSTDRVANTPLLSASFSSEKLSTNGKVHHAVISSDGKNVVYTNGFKDKQSVWLRQLESSNNVQIIPPSDDFYGGLALSPDGKSFAVAQGGWLHDAVLLKGLK